MISDETRRVWVRPQYGTEHKQIRARLEPLVLAGDVTCWRCEEPIRPGEPWHLGHVDGDPTRYAGPEHRRCNVATAGRRFEPLPAPVRPPEPVGLEAADERWRVPWLKGLRRVPKDAVWPRYMTVPHPSAVGSLGPEFIRWAEAREGRALRWWQRLVAARLLEHDDAERLVWETLLLTMARQLGKSWLLRELILWRMHQADRFGEIQDVLHTGKDLQVCKEVIRPAMFWAQGRDGYTVRYANGEQGIEWNRCRWMLRAKGSPYGSSVSVAAVDEAWKVKPEIVDEGVIPTMVEREQPQLWLISTAHREATALMLTRRKLALQDLETGSGDLLIEWSAPRDAVLDDVKAWRAASPHWTAQRERLVARQLEAARTGEAEIVEDEADPIEAWKSQWINVWPDRFVPTGTGERLLPAGLWGFLAEPGVTGDGPLFVAVEDDFGNGAAVAAASRLDDGRIEVDGWPCADWDSAILDAARLGTVRRVRQLLVGASLLNRVPPGTAPTPRPAAAAETRLGLPLLRDLCQGGMIVHDVNQDLADAVENAQVKELSSGLSLERGPGYPLVKALLWAVGAAHKPAPMPAVY